MPTKEPILREKRRDAVDLTFRKLRELIVHGKIAPGTQIVEAALADRLGVSRTPIRAALHRLQQEGYVTVSPNISAKSRLAVAPLTQEDARELYKIVGHVEALAASTTAQLDPDRRMKVVSKLKLINERLRKLATTEQRDANEVFELDMQLHGAIFEAGAGPRLLAFHKVIKPQTERYWRLYANAVMDQLKVSVAEHVDIIQAIETGDASAAESGMKVNWEQGAERLCKVIARLGELGSW